MGSLWQQQLASTRGGKVQGAQSLSKSLPHVQACPQLEAYQQLI